MKKEDGPEKLSAFIYFMIQFQRFLAIAGRRHVRRLLLHLISLSGKDEATSHFQRFLEATT
jgi:hypothetical protein